jgi:hypothetical protein
MKCYSALKKKELVSLVTACINLEDIVSSDIGETSTAGLIYVQNVSKVESKGAENRKVGTWGRRHQEARSQSRTQNFP